MVGALAWVLPLRHLHVTRVALSGGLFALRGVAVLLHARWPMRTVRVGSVVIDTTLPAAGVALWTILHVNPLRDPWLAAKRVPLLLCVVLGIAVARRSLDVWRLA